MTSPNEYDAASSGLRVCVVTIAYNPGRELVKFAATLRGAAAGLGVDLVIVDNGEERELVDQVARRFGARVVRPGRNLGYGGAANLGAETMTAQHDWLLVANPDVAWQPGALKALVEAGERHPQAGSLGPRILNLDGTVYPSARALPSLTAGAGHAVFAHVWPGNPWTARYRQTQEVMGETEHPCGWLSGACLLVRREAWDQVGGFDTSYFMFFEDVDLGERLGEAGWENVYVPGAVVVHDQGRSWRDKPAAMIRAHHDSAEQYLTRRYAAPWQAPLRGALALGLRARCWWQAR